MIKTGDTIKINSRFQPAEMKDKVLGEIGIVDHIENRGTDDNPVLVLYLKMHNGMRLKAFLEWVDLVDSSQLFNDETISIKKSELMAIVADAAAGMIGAIESQIFEGGNYGTDDE